MKGFLIKPENRCWDENMPEKDYLKKIYAELKNLKSEVASLRAAMVPEIRLGRVEMSEIRKLKEEARAGKLTRLEDAAR